MVVPHTGSKRPYFSLGLAIVLSLLLLSAANAQVDAGSLQGQVTDSTGSAVPDVLVTLRNEDTGVTATTRTDIRGEYSSRLCGSAHTAFRWRGTDSSGRNRGISG
jgi:Carboxypeptidase regulatory-like domain